MNDKLDQIRKYIHEQLSDYPNFAGIDYSHSVRGIKIRGHHAITTPKYGYTYPEYQPTIKPDFSNLQEAADEFIEVWKKYDTEEWQKYYINMYIDFARYGTE